MGYTTAAEIDLCPVIQSMLVANYVISLSKVVVLVKGIHTHTHVVQGSETETGNTMDK